MPTTPHSQIEALNPSLLDSIVNKPAQDLTTAPDIPSKYFENSRNIATYQYLAHTGRADSWLQASIKGEPLPEVPDNIRTRITYTGEGVDAVSTSIKHSMNQITRIANSIDINKPEDKPSHEIFYAKHQYRQYENYIIQNNMDRAIEEGIVDSTSLAVLPFDGARALGETIENHAVKMPILTSNFKRIKKEDGNTLVAIAGLEVEGQVPEKVRSIAWVDDCLASGVTTKSAMEMLKNVSDTFVIIVTTANEEASTELIRYGMDELGYKDVRVIAAKKNTLLDDSHYLLTQHPDDPMRVVYEVSDMGEWGRPMPWEESIWWGYKKKAAKVTKVGDPPMAA